MSNTATATTTMPPYDGAVEVEHDTIARTLIEAVTPSGFTAEQVNEVTGRGIVYARYGRADGSRLVLRLNERYGLSYALTVNSQSEAEPRCFGDGYLWTDRDSFRRVRRNVRLALMRYA